LSTSRAFDAEEALQIGFVTKIAPHSKWEEVISSAKSNSTLLTPTASKAMRARIIQDTRIQDMAALANSVARPGLKERIRQYRSASRQLSNQ
jgi:enoyl-CoA hydratase/carnithine racemase